MICEKCGKEIADGSFFCMFCGSPVSAPAEPVEIEPKEEPVDLGLPTEEEPITPRKPFIEDFNFDVKDYPDAREVKKTDDIADFDWEADPSKITDTFFGRSKKPAEPAPEIEIPTPKAEDFKMPAPSEPQTVSTLDLQKAIFGESEPERELSASEKIDKFYTINQKNEEFQALLNKEYDKIKSGNAIGQEMSQADERAEYRFDTRKEDTSMEAFLEKEGIVKPYQPKAFESDVLARIEAQEAAREAERIEEEARAKALEEARLEAEAQRKAEEEAAHQAEIARIQAEEARKAEEARLKAEEEAKIRAEEERLRAEAEARVRAAEEERLRAEADLRAAQEAAKIRAQQEARIAAEEEAKRQAEQERRRAEEQELQAKLEMEQNRLAREADSAVMEKEAQRVMEQTMQIKENQTAKIMAAVAEMKGVADLTTEPVEAEEPAINPAVEAAHEATRNDINEMAAARAAFFAELEDTEPKPFVPADGDFSGYAPAEQEAEADDLTSTRVIDKAAVMAGMEPTQRISRAELHAQIDKEFFASLDDAASVEEPVPAEPEKKDSVDDLLDQFMADVPLTPEPVEEPVEEAAEVEEAKDLSDILSEDEDLMTVEDLFAETAEPADEEAPFAVPKDEPTDVPVTENPKENSNLEDTMIMPAAGLAVPMDEDFADYGEAEAEALRKQQQAQAMDDFFADMPEDDFSEEAPAQEEAFEEPAEEAAELMDDEQPAMDFEEEYEEHEKKGGAGRVILKIILIILVVIFAAELAGIAIKFAAPNSAPAQFIEEQLNNVIHLITG